MGYLHTSFAAYPSFSFIHCWGNKQQRNTMNIHRNRFACLPNLTPVLSFILFAPFTNHSISKNGHALVCFFPVSNCATWLATWSSEVFILGSAILMFLLPGSSGLCLSPCSPTAKWCWLWFQLSH